MSERNSFFSVNHLSVRIYISDLKVLDDRERHSTITYSVGYYN